MSVEVANFDQICRTCLSRDDLRAICENTIIGKLLKDWFLLNIENEEQMPINICANCVTKIQQFNDFKNMVQQTTKELEKVLVNHKAAEFQKRFFLGELQFEFACDRTESGDATTTCAQELEPQEKEIANKEIILKMLENLQKIDLSKTVECKLCEKIVSRKGFKMHLRTHTKEKPFVCTICEKAFSLEKNLKRHTMTHTGERPFICHICSKGFIQAVTLQVHLKTHEPKEDCKVEDGSYVCEICGRQFQRYAYYSTHKKSHQEDIPESKAIDVPRERRHNCPICKRSYYNSSALKSHLLTHGEKSFLCNVCGKFFSTKGTLDCHKRTHTKERPYKCLICDKSFTHSNSLYSHKALHKGLKQFSCTDCGKSFTQKPHLMQHMRIHTGEKPHECSYCGKSFALKGNLKVHTRIHTGETPYVCSICRKGFYDSSGLKKHQRLHQENEETTCEIQLDI